MHFGDRLSEFRKERGFSQKEFSRIVGVSKTTQVNYESGKRSPNVDYWQQVSAIGADIQYILTGEPSGKSTNLGDLDPKAAESNGKLASVANLPLDEQMLLMAFRTLDKAGKAQALGLISGLEPAETPQKTASSNPKIVINGSVGQSVDSQTASNFTIDMRKGVDKKDE